MEYEKYTIETDTFKRRKHIYYLGALVKGKNEEHIIASYSLKTKQLIIKNVDFHIPPSNVLKEFVKICEQKGEWK